MCIMEIHAMGIISFPNFPSTKQRQKDQRNEAQRPFYVEALKRVILNSSTKSFLKFFRYIL